MENVIYCIYNEITDKIYIGSTKNIYGRLKNHLIKLSKKQHENSYLQNTFNKYGIDSFHFNVLEYCKKDNLIKREQYYIDLYNSSNRKYGYNLITYSRRKIYTDEIKKKISDSLKGHKTSLETRRKLSLANKGRKMSKEFCDKVSKSLTGRKLSEEHKKNISKSSSNISKETRLKKSIAAKNRDYKPHSEKTKLKISESLKKAHLKRKLQFQLG